MNANLILDRLTETLNQKTEQALARLDCLEHDVTAVVQQAEQLAHERITAAVARLDGIIGEALAASEATIAVLAANAVDGLLQRLTVRLNGYTDTGVPGVVVPAEQPQEDEPVGEPTPPVEIPEPIADPEPVILPAPEAIPTEEVPVAEALPIAAAAHSVATLDDVGFLPCETSDSEEEPVEPEEVPPVGAESADDVPTTDDPAGLHTRHGTGRATRYEPAEMPEPGETYFRKVGRRWLVVVFAG